jgi:L-lysine 6-transaminase
LRRLAAAFPRLVANVRGLGLYQGFSLATPALRDQLADDALQKENLLLLPAGANSIRTRPNLSVTAADVDLFLEMLARRLQGLPV